MDTLDFYTNKDKILRNELDAFVGTYDGTNLNAIQALADKIDHMCRVIGSPSSVKPMLQSIIKGKIKIWATGGGNTDAGTKLKGRIHIAELDRKHSDLKYTLKDGITEATKESDYKYTVVRKHYVKGHFRWNFQAYTLGYEERNHIQEFFFDKTSQKTKRKGANGIRFNIRNGRVQKHSDTMYTYEFFTTEGNEYRFHIYLDETNPTGWQPKITCQIGDGMVTNAERRFVLSELARFDKKFDYLYKTFG